VRVKEHTPTITPSAVPTAQVRSCSNNTLKRPREPPRPIQMKVQSPTCNNPLASKIPTVEEERELKKQKRLIKNRESAQKSRQKRKQQFEELEQKNKALEAQNKQLIQENKKLREEVFMLKKHQSANGGLHHEGPTTTSGTTGVRTTLAVVMLLFGLGLFFNSPPLHGPGLPFDPHTPREPIPEVLPPGGRYGGRMLKSFRDSHLAESLHLSERTRGKKSVVKPSKDVSLSSPQQIPPQDTVIQQEPMVENSGNRTREAPTINKQKKPGSWTKSPVNVMDSEPHEGGIVPKITRDELVPRTSSGRKSYLFCSDVQEIMMDTDTLPGMDDSPQRTVSLLLPLNALLKEAAGEEEEGDNRPRGFLSEQLRKHHSAIPSSSSSLVEVACRVLNMHIYSPPRVQAPDRISVV